MKTTIATLMLIAATVGSTVFAQGRSDQITITVRANEVLQALRAGDDISEYCLLDDNQHPGQSISGSALRGNVTAVSPGDEVVWRFIVQGPAKSVSIVSFNFEEQEGSANFFAQSGGSAPTANADGTWSATVSPEAQAGASLKYTVTVAIEGQNFIVDPVLTIPDGGQ